MTTMLSKAFNRPCLAFTCVLLFSCNGAAGERTTAYCYFTSTDGSYLNGEEAAKLADLALVLLQAETDLEFVDRERVDELLEELGARGLGGLDPSQSLSLGKWLEADLLIKGVFRLDAAQGWRLDLEIIDLFRADVVAQKSFTLKGQKNRLEATESLARDITRQILALLPKAKAVREGASEQILVAPLHFQNTHRNRRLDFLEDDLRAVFRQQNELQKQRRYLQFPRAQDAFTESSFVASGIAETDPDEWSRIADYYVWGTYEEIESSGVPFDEVTIDLHLSWWNGGSERGKATLRGVVGEREQLLQQALLRIQGVAEQKQLDEIDPKARNQIARAFYQRALSRQIDTLQAELKNSSEVTERWVRLWRQTRRLLSVAAYLAPADEVICRELLVESTRSDLPHRTIAGNHEMTRLLRCNRLWEQHNQSFGVDFAIDPLKRFPGRPGAFTDNRLSSRDGLEHYLRGTEDLLKYLASEIASSPYRPRETDVPIPVLKAWQADVSREYLARVELVTGKQPKTISSRVYRFFDVAATLDSDATSATLFEQIWPAVVSGSTLRRSSLEPRVRLLYKRLGKPEEGEKLLAELDTRQLPDASRARGYRPHRPSDFPQAKPFAPLAAQVKLSARPVSVARWWSTRKLTSLCNAGGRLWCGFEGDDRRAGRPGNGLFAWNKQQGWREWGGLNRLASQTTAMVEHDGHLWLTFAGDDPACLELETGRVRRFSARRGSPSKELYAVCRGGDTLYFGGGEPTSGVLAALNPSSLEWRQIDLGECRPRDKTYPIPRVKQLAADTSWIAVYAETWGSLNQIMLYQTEGGRRIDAGAMLRESHPGFSHFTSSWRPKVHGMEFVDGTLWVATSRGLLAFDPQEERWTRTELLPCELTSVRKDGNLLWFGACPFRGNGTLQGTERHAQLLLFDTAGREWLAQASLPHPGHVSALTRDRDTLWAGIGESRCLALAFDVTALRSAHHTHPGASKDQR